MNVKQLLGIMVLSLSLMAQAAFAGNDPSIKGEVRTNIGKAMQEFIHNNTFNGQFVVYDAVEGEVLRLNFDKLHDGIIKKGDYYVSCADFIDPLGRKIDIDFLVVGVGNHYQTLEAVVHSIDGNKRKYHLES